MTRQMRHIFKTLSQPLSILLFAAALLLAQPVSVFASEPRQPATKSGTNQSTVIVKFKAADSIALEGMNFTRQSQPDSRLNSLLARDVAAKRPLINETKASIQQSRTGLVTPLEAGEGDLENYYVLRLAPGKKADDVAARLNTLPSVVTAYAQPTVALPLASTTPNFTQYQAHLKAAPFGLGLRTTVGGSTNGTPYPGSGGHLVRVVDLENSWNTRHEDLSVLRKPTTAWKYGTPMDLGGDGGSHGTATAGIIAADYNRFGVTGIVPKTEFHTMNASSPEHGTNIAGSIHAAASRMTVGDILVIPIGFNAPDKKGTAPIEIEPAVYDTIRWATAKGITVIEAAGNGLYDRDQGYNLDNALFKGAFTTKHNSGAIMVGAGSIGCSNANTLRSRLAFSNYGSRVDIQGPGECVVTAGYGDLHETNNTANQWYTSTYGGTSSASAVIAGAAAQISSAYEAINKTPMKPADLKAALKAGALPQNTTKVKGNIGPMPNLAVALRTTDKTKPTAPSALTAKLATATKVNLAWKPATDNLGYVRYNVFRNGVFLKQVATTTYTDSTVTRSGTYTYKVLAIDASKNNSAFSNTATVVKK